MFPRDLTGLKFGRLTVLKKATPPEHLKDKHSSYWYCRCTCGNKDEVIVVRSSLTSGATKSCGCISKEMMMERGENTIHGMSKTRFWRLWKNIFRRCYSSKHNQYYNYGDRGIEVCERWHIFENFMEDMYDGYVKFEKEHGKDTATIDRIDSDKNYCKENCRWATQLEQARNRKDNISVVIDGIEYNTLSEVAEKFGLNYQTVAQRYRNGKRGFDLIKKSRQKLQAEKSKNPNSIAVEVNGKQYESLTALQKDYPYISLVSISKRYKKGLRGADLIRR